MFLGIETETVNCLPTVPKKVEGGWPIRGIAAVTSPSVAVTHCDCQVPTGDCSESVPSQVPIPIMYSVRDTARLIDSNLRLQWKMVTTWAPHAPWSFTPSLLDSRLHHRPFPWNLDPDEINVFGVPSPASPVSAASSLNFLNSPTSTSSTLRLHALRTGYLVPDAASVPVPLRIRARTLNRNTDMSQSSTRGP